MTDVPPDHPAPEPDTAEQPAMTTGRRRALERKGAREPRRIPRTRVRVSTVVLVLVFIGLVAIYPNEDETTSGTTKTPVTTSEEYVPTTQTPTSTTTPSTSAAETSTTPGAGQGATSDDGAETGSSVTLAPGVVIPVPEIPGQQTTGTQTPQTTSR